MMVQTGFPLQDPSSSYVLSLKPFWLLQLFVVSAILCDNFFCHSIKFENALSVFSLEELRLTVIWIHYGVFQPSGYITVFFNHLVLSLFFSQAIHSKCDFNFSLHNVVKVLMLILALEALQNPNYDLF